MPARSEHQLIEDRAIISRMYRQGYLQREIRDYLNSREADVDFPEGYVNITQQQISYDLKKIQQQWVDEMFTNIDQMRAEQLAKIDALEQEYWEAWRASKGEQIKTRQKVDDIEKLKRDKSSVAVESTTEKIISPGDKQFLDGVMKCIETRIKLLGLDAPQKMRWVDEEGDDVVSVRKIADVGQWLRRLSQDALPPPLD